MKRLFDWLGRMDRLQQTRLFKIIAASVVVIACVGGLIWYTVAAAAHASSSIITPDVFAEVTGADGAPPAGAEGAQPAPAKTELDATAKIINDILRTKQSSAGVAVGLAIIVALSMVVIWLGLGLTYLGLAIVGGAVVLGCIAAGRGSDLGIAAGGLAGIAAAFAAIMQALRLSLSGSGPVRAVARNVLAEAMRMKISIVFIVLVVFSLAALPLMQDATQPLRYRVQSFLQFSTAGSFWLIAILVLAFSVSTIAVEQRDKIIWQTMTKPVAPWQYILGKWLGITALSGALLLVCATGIFMFTEYLRSQPAINETNAYVARAGKGITEDRLVLETQILTARTAVRPEAPQLDEEQFRKNVEDRVRQELALVEQSTSNPEVLNNARILATTKVADSLRKSVLAEFRAIGPGQRRDYTFTGLGDAKSSNRPVILRFKFDSGANRPDAEPRVTIGFSGGGYQVETIGLGQYHTIPVSPEVIDANGKLVVTVINGDIQRQVANTEFISFAAEGMEISYSSGGFRANFFRCIGVLWIKLSFLAMLAITAGTFLSFPVACLVSFTVFLSAEGAGFISGALENYATEDREGKTIIFNTVIAKVAEVVSGAFKIYADLRPTGRIVEGLALSWLDIAGGLVVLAGATGVLYAIATFIFRRRELAMYSGQ